MSSEMDPTFSQMRSRYSSSFSLKSVAFSSMSFAVFSRLRVDNFKQKTAYEIRA